MFEADFVYGPGGGAAAAVSEAPEEDDAGAVLVGDSSYASDDAMASTVRRGGALARSLMQAAQGVLDHAEGQEEEEEDEEAMLAAQAVRRRVTGDILAHGAPAAAPEGGPPAAAAGPVRGGPAPLDDESPSRLPRIVTTRRAAERTAATPAPPRAADLPSPTPGPGPFRIGSSPRGRASAPPAEPAVRPANPLSPPGSARVPTPQNDGDAWGSPLSDARRGRPDTSAGSSSSPAAEASADLPSGSSSFATPGRLGPAELRSSAGSLAERGGSPSHGPGSGHAAPHTAAGAPATPSRRGRASAATPQASAAAPPSRPTPAAEQAGSAAGSLTHAATGTRTTPDRRLRPPAGASARLPTPAAQPVARAESGAVAPSRGHHDARPAPVAAVGPASATSAIGRPARPAATAAAPSRGAAVAAGPAARRPAAPAADLDTEPGHWRSAAAPGASRLYFYHRPSRASVWRLPADVDPRDVRHKLPDGSLAGSAWDAARVLGYSLPLPPAAADRDAKPTPAPAVQARPAAAHATGPEPPAVPARPAAPAAASLLEPAGASAGPGAAAVTSRPNAAGRPDDAADRPPLPGRDEARRSAGRSALLEAVAALQDASRDDDSEGEGDGTSRAGDEGDTAARGSDDDDAASSVSEDSAGGSTGVDDAPHAGAGGAPAESHGPTAAVAAPVPSTSQAGDEGSSDFETPRELTADASAGSIESRATARPVSRRQPPARALPAAPAPAPGPVVDRWGPAPGGATAPSPQDGEAAPAEHEECPDCGRVFALGRLAPHARVCRRVFGARRQTFSSQQRRLRFHPAAAYRRVPDCHGCGKAFSHDDDARIHALVCKQAHATHAGAGRRADPAERAAPFAQSATPASTRRGAGRRPLNAAAATTGRRPRHRRAPAPAGTAVAPPQHPLPATAVKPPQRRARSARRSTSASRLPASRPGPAPATAEPAADDVDRLLAEGEAVLQHGMGRLAATAGRRPTPPLQRRLDWDDASSDTGTATAAASIRAARHARDARAGLPRSRIPVPSRPDPHAEREPVTAREARPAAEHRRPAARGLAPAPTAGEALLRSLEGAGELLVDAPPLDWTPYKVHHAVRASVASDAYGAAERQAARESVGDETDDFFDEAPPLPREAAHASGTTPFAAGKASAATAVRGTAATQRSATSGRSGDTAKLVSAATAAIAASGITPARTRAMQWGDTVRRALFSGREAAGRAAAGHAEHALVA